MRRGWAWLGLLALAGTGALAEAGRLPPGRALVGRYAGWAVFRAASPPACFAVALPRERAGGDAPPFLAFTRRAGLAAPAELHLRLSRPRDEARPVTLAVGGRRFALLARGQDAWARDARDDARILAALRGQEALAVTARGARGHPFTDTYPLAGAPSAIDAAIIACLAG